ncbi:hypothetical protein NJ76_29205 [Rhodococcus sp. IITR03]|nr:hypothetical protein NJ76_29205 [Rhodococcus sp. IITR03]
MAVFNRTTRLRDPSVQRLAPRGPTRPTQPLEPQRREYRLSIVVASMAIAGTLLGSVSAGVFNLVNSSEQAEAAITQSNNEFWKAQRQQVYTDFLVVADQVSQFAGQLSQALNPEIPLNAEQREAAIMQPRNLSPTTLSICTPSFQPYNCWVPPQVAEAAVQVVVKVAEASKVILYLTNDQMYDLSNVATAEVARSQEEFAAQAHVTSEARAGYLEAVQTELGIPGLNTPK